MSTTTAHEVAREPRALLQPCSLHRSALRECTPGGANARTVSPGIGAKQTEASAEGPEGSAWRRKRVLRRLLYGWQAVVWASKQQAEAELAAEARRRATLQALESQALRPHGKTIAPPAAPSAQRLDRHAEDPMPRRRAPPSGGMPREMPGNAAVAGGTGGGAGAGARKTHDDKGGARPAASSRAGDARTPAAPPLVAQGAGRRAPAGARLSDRPVRTAHRQPPVQQLDHAAELRARAIAAEERAFTQRLQRELRAVAGLHAARGVMRFYGLVPWLALVRLRRAAWARAGAHGERSLAARTLRAWAQAMRTSQAARRLAVWVRGHALRLRSTDRSVRVALAAWTRRWSRERDVHLLLRWQEGTYQRRCVTVGLGALRRNADEARLAQATAVASRCVVGVHPAGSAPRDDIAAAPPPASILEMQARCPRRPAWLAETSSGRRAPA